MSLPRAKVQKKVRALVNDISKREGLVVAFSGGVDSTVLAKLAYQALGAKAIAVTEDSDLMPRAEVKKSRSLARLIGISQFVIKREGLDDEMIIKNPSDRCYHCRKGLVEILKRLAAAHGISTIADGANMSDLGEHRPGIKAADEGGVWHPFIDQKVDKVMIRAMAKELGIPIHNKPAAACLASRIPYGHTITRKKLEQVEKAESFLQGIGLSHVRVRHHGDVARIEVPKKDFKKFREERFRAKIISKLKRLGFRYITIDLLGYRPGSMDEAISRK